MSKFGDEEAAELQSRTYLHKINLSRTQISDEAIKSLSGMSELESLYLIDTNIDGKALPDIAKLSSLKVLDLSNTKVAGENLRLLAQLPKLEQLDLDGTPIQEIDLKYLRGCRVRNLDISDTDISDHVFELLKQLPNLENLSIRNTGIKLNFAAWKSNFPELQIDNMTLASFAQFSKNKRRVPRIKEQAEPANSRKRIALLTKRIESENSGWADQLERASLLTSQGNYQSAIPLFEELIPNLNGGRQGARCGTMGDMFAYAEFCARTNCATCYLAIGDFKKAESMAAAAILLQRVSPIPRRIRGEAYLKQGLLPEALSDLNRAIYLDPSMGSAYYLRGISEQKLGKDKEAKADLSKAKRFGFNENSKKPKAIIY